MKSVVFLELGAVAAAFLAAPVFAKPNGPISCPLDSMPVTTRQKLGDTLVNGSAADNGAAMTNAQKVIGNASATCAKTYRWTTSQADTATAWGTWKVMADTLQRAASLSTADVAVFRAYIDEDPKRVDGLDRSTPAQRAAIAGALRQRGAHVHDSGDVADQEMGLLLVIKEIRAQELEFAAS